MDIYGIKDFLEVQIGGTIKKEPEDFIVEEIMPSGKTCSVDTGIIEKILDWLPKKREEQLHFTLLKRDYTTQRAIKQIASRLRISDRRFGYAGTKDKRALTAQRISVWNIPIRELKKIKARDMLIKNYNYSKQRLNLGDLSGNRFTITIRDITIPSEEIKEKIVKFAKELSSSLPNYFGPQRFGVQRAINYIVGKNLLLRNFEEAAKALIAYPGNESADATSARKFATENWGKWAEILKIWPRFLGIEAALLNYLVQYPTDYANAFRRLPKNLRRMFIHAVQSYIYNVTLTKLLEAGKTLPDTLPLIGYGTNLESEVGKIIKETAEAEGIDCELFRLKHMPELAEAGEERNTKLTIKNFRVLHIGKDVATIRFILDKGSYATVLLKALLGTYYE